MYNSLFFSFCLYLPAYFDMLIFIETANRRIVEVDLPCTNNYEIVRLIRDMCRRNQDGYVGLQPIIFGHSLSSDAAMLQYFQHCFSSSGCYLCCGMISYQIIWLIRDVCRINQDGYVGLQPISFGLSLSNDAVMLEDI